MIHSSSENKGENADGEKGRGVQFSSPHLGEASASSRPTSAIEDKDFGDATKAVLQEFRSVEEKKAGIACQHLKLSDFIGLVLKDPRHHIRNAFQYTADAMESFGFEDKTILGREIRDFSFREWPWESTLVRDRKILEGQELALYDFYQQMKMFGRRESANRMFVFHGPPGSGKTRLNDTIDAMLENYSELNPKGALYRLVWVFPEGGRKKQFGFASLMAEKQRVEEQQDLHGGQLIYRPTGNTDPLFLLAKSFDNHGPRDKLLSILSADGRLPDDLNVDYFLRGELDTFSESLLDSLVDFYREELRRSKEQGAKTVDEGEVFREVIRSHARIERYTLSSRQGRGLCSYSGTANKNADIEPFYSTYAPPPEEIRAAEREIYMPKSFMLRANRGHLHFSDLFRPDGHDRSREDISSLNHLLNEIESGDTEIVSLKRAAAIRREKVNLVIRADANDDLISAKMGGPGWDSLGRRIQFISAPHLTRYLSEAAANRDFFSTIVGTSRVICPHVLDSVSLFVTATRLIRPTPEAFEPVHEDLPSVLRSMSVVEKALLLQEPRDGVKSPLNMLKKDEAKRWTQDDLRILRRYLPKIATEYALGEGEIGKGLYDGGFGISTANTQDLLREVSVQRMGEPITVLEVLSVLERHVEGFSYYQRIKELKERQVQQRVEAKRAAAEKKGGEISDSDLKGFRRQASKDVEELFPIPSPREILSDVESYARRMILDDFYRAMGIASEAESTFSIKRYLEHARVSLGKSPSEVSPEHRVSERERGANQKLLEDFEDRVVASVDFSSEEERLAFRRKLFGQIGNWQAENPDKKASENYDVIFGELVEGLRKAQRDLLEKPLKEFAERTNQYADDPTRYQKDTAGKEEERRKALRWKATIRALQDTLGYPEESDYKTIRKNLEWALKG